MISEFRAFFAAFQQGKQLASSKTWKNRQIAAGALTSFLGAAIVIAKGFGYDLQIDQATLEAFAGGVAAVYGVFNAIIAATTSKTVGVPTEGSSAVEP